MRESAGADAKRALFNMCIARSLNNEDSVVIYWQLVIRLRRQCRLSVVRVGNCTSRVRVGVTSNCRT